MKSFKQITSLAIAGMALASCSGLAETIDNIKDQAQELISQINVDPASLQKLMDNASQGMNATASSANSTVREVGIALGIAVLTAVFIGAGGSLTPTGYTDALAPALLVGAGAVAIGLVAALFMPGRSVGSAQVLTVGREMPSTTD